MLPHWPRSQKLYKGSITLDTMHTSLQTIYSHLLNLQAPLPLLNFEGTGTPGVEHYNSITLPKSLLLFPRQMQKNRFLKWLPLSPPKNAKKTIGIMYLPICIMFGKLGKLTPSTAPIKLVQKKAKMYCIFPFALAEKKDEPYFPSKDSLLLLVWRMERSFPSLSMSTPPGLPSCTEAPSCGCSKHTGIAVDAVFLVPLSLVLKTSFALCSRFFPVIRRFLANLCLFLSPSSA